MAANVTLIEDEALFRDLLRRALELTGRVRVLDSLGSVQEAYDSPAVARSDAVLLDIDLAGGDGIALGQRLRQLHPTLGIVLLSNHADLAFARGMSGRHLTGWAYLLKKSVRDLHTILRAIEGVRQGQVVLDPLLIDPQPFPDARYAHLTVRQLELWQLITQGYSNGEMARRLSLSPKWVENAVSGLYAALQLETHDARLNARVSAALLYVRESQRHNLTVLRRGGSEDG